MLKFPRLIYKIKTVPPQLLMDLFCETQQVDSKVETEK